MEAKDTVMTDKQVEKWSLDRLGRGNIQDLAKAQAEISFRAGYIQCLKDHNLDIPLSEVERLIKQARNEGYRAGIKEVVERINQEGMDMFSGGLLPDNFDYSENYILIKRAKLKEWEIEDA